MKVNGSLVFDASSASEIQNLRVQKMAGTAVPAFTSADTGRVIFVTTTGGIFTGNTLYYGSQGASNWVAVATGGNAAALQTEVDAIETSLGAIVNSNGVWVTGQVTGPAFSGSEATLTAVLQALSNYATNNNELSELDDVTLTSPTTGQFLVKSSTFWINKTLTVSDIPSLTVTSAQINNVAATTASTTELNFVTGVTSAIQTQFNNKQALDAGLTSLAALSATGLIVQTADNVFASRSLVAPSQGLTITDPAGLAGNPTFALANDLAALEGLTTVGYVVRTGDGSATTRALTGVVGNTVITNGSGVASDTTIDLATVTQGTSGNFRKVTLDAFGRVSGNTPVITADITSLVDATYVNVTGDTMTGALIMGSGARISLPDAPVGATDATNKAYVDALTQGLTWKTAVRAATTGNISLASAAAGYDGITLVVGNRLLVKNQTASAENGIYIFNGAGAALTRALDMDAANEFDGAAVFVQEGTVNEGAGYTETATVTVVGTSAVAFAQFTGGALYTWGDGLVQSGNTININMGAGIIMLPSDEVGIDLYDEPNGALILTSDGSTHSTSTSSKLFLKLDGAGALQQTLAGLKIGAAAVSNAMLSNSIITFNGDTGVDAVALGETMQIIGTSAQGITTAVTNNVVTITAANASSTQKGVASFATGDFDVVAGVVTVKAAGIDNAQLAFSTLTLTGIDAVGAASSDPVSLGESVSFVGAIGSPISTQIGANSVIFSARDATTALKGVASFAGSDFVVTAGVVTAIAKDLDSLTDVTITSPAQGQTLVRDGAGQFTNQKIYHLHTQGGAATSWTVAHALGQKYCVVTVVDSTDDVVIPQSITFNSTTSLTVTFNTAISGSVVVMGIA